MKAPALERTSAAKAGWVVIALTVGWSVFLLLPDPPEKSLTKPATIPRPLSKLQQVGLRDNPDWEGLPEYFAVWADGLEWVGDRTQFAYWNPGANSYSYYFEANRGSGKVQFREISTMEAFRHRWIDENGGYIRTKNANLLEAKQLTPMEFKSESSAHPFVFFHSLTVPPWPRDIVVKRPDKKGAPRNGTSPKVKLDMAAPKILPPDVNVSPVNFAQKR